MQDITKVLLTIFGAIIALAIVSVLVSRKSRAPEAITALTGGLASVVAAAVDPAATAGTNGDLGNSTFTTPAGASGALSGIAKDAMNAAMGQARGILKGTFGL